LHGAAGGGEGLLTEGIEVSRSNIAVGLDVEVVGKSFAAIKT